MLAALAVVGTAIIVINKQSITIMDILFLTFSIVNHFFHNFSLSRFSVFLSPPAILNMCACYFTTKKAQFCSMTKTVLFLTLFAYFLTAKRHTDLHSSLNLLDLCVSFPFFC